MCKLFIGLGLKDAPHKAKLSLWENCSLSQIALRPGLHLTCSLGWFPIRIAGTCSTTIARTYLHDSTGPNSAVHDSPCSMSEKKTPNRRQKSARETPRARTFQNKSPETSARISLQRSPVARQSLNFLHSPTRDAPKAMSPSDKIGSKRTTKGALICQDCTRKVVRPF